MKTWTLSVLAFVRRVCFAERNFVQQGSSGKKGKKRDLFFFYSCKKIESLENFISQGLLRSKLQQPF